jgi:hypothetical protein
MKKFLLVDKYKGYANNRDITNIDPEFLVPPSQNVLINEGEKVSNSPGYTLYGAANATLFPVKSSFEWKTSTGPEYALRSYDDELEVYYGGSWIRVQDAYTSVDFSFTTFFDSTEKIDLLLFVNGDSNMRMWSGGLTTFASATATTITKQGTSTFAEERFLLAGTRGFRIGTTSYTYTGGEGTTTLTGVAPNPTAAGHAVGSVVIQSTRVTATTPASGFMNDIIGTLYNQVYVGDFNRRDIYVSKNTSYIDFTFTAGAGGRAPGEGALLTLDATPIAFVPAEEEMYVGVQDGWFQTKFTLSADLTKETMQIKRLKSSRGKAIASKNSFTKAANYILYYTIDNQIDFLGRVENITTPESQPLSDPIKLELLAYNTTIAPHMKYWNNQLFACFPSEGKTLIYDFDRKYWQPPQTWSIRRLAVIGDELYAHSSAVPESYKMLDTTAYSFNTNPVDSRAAFAYRNYGDRFWKKNCDEWATEGYIKSNTTLTATFKYDFGGFTSIISKDIDGTDTDILFSTTTDGSLGKWPLGSQPLGGTTDSPSDLAKFRIIHEITDQGLDFYEQQVVYSTNDVDQRWEIISSGGNVKLSTNDNKNIKK